MQGPLLDNTQHSQETEINGPVELEHAIPTSELPMGCAMNVFKETKSDIENYLCYFILHCVFSSARNKICKRLDRISRGKR